MKNKISILLLITLSSCCDTYHETTYSYLGITILRIDTCGKTEFIYKKGNDEMGKIWTTYSGINDGFSGYLEFKNEGEVTLLSGDGYFEGIDLDSGILNYRRIAGYERPKDFKNVCYITLATNYEKERNEELKSGIKIDY